MKIERPKNDEFYEYTDDFTNDPFDDAIHEVCFTGHRNVPKNLKPALTELLAEIVESLYNRGARIFKAGGAVGFDTMAAQAVIDLKAKTRDGDIKLCLCLSSKQQSKSFSRFDQIIYNLILENSDSVSYESNVSNTESYYARNRRLVSGSDVCVAFCTSQRGGTYYTCTQALMSGVEFINLADFIEFE
ncbi:MAG: SLOG family protein [Clostridia bacterium]|nr:SLOG family protein [Clostridia bacterium]